MTVRKKSDILCELLIRVLLTEPASLGKTVSPSERSGAVGRAVNDGGFGRTIISVTADAICSVIVPFDIFVKRFEKLFGCCDVDDDEVEDEDDDEVLMVADVVTVDNDGATLTTAGIVVIDNGGGPFDIACDTAVNAAADAAVIEVV